LRLFSFGGYGLALAALALVVFGAIECPPHFLYSSILAFFVWPNGASHRAHDLLFPSLTCSFLLGGIFCLWCSTGFRQVHKPHSCHELWRLRLFSSGGYGLALAALALVVFGAYDSYPGSIRLE